MKKLSCVLLLAAGQALAGNPAFDPATNVLTLPSLDISGATYSNVKVRLGAVEVLAMDATPATPTNPCTDTQVSKDTYKALRAMEGKPATRAQLENLVGCPATNGDPSGSSLIWQSTQSTNKISLLIVGGVIQPGLVSSTPSSWYF